MCLVVVGAEKWSGSVFDGIMHLRSYDSVVVHPRCTNVIHEMNSYLWKKDKQTDEILAQPIDKDNHWMDALRYALSDVIEKTRATGYSNMGY